jgi:hypothetical protein
VVSKINEATDPVMWCVWNIQGDYLFWSHHLKSRCDEYVSAALIPDWLEVRPLYLHPIANQHLQKP